MPAPATNRFDKTFLLVILFLAIGLVGLFVLLTGDQASEGVKGDNTNVSYDQNGTQVITVNVNFSGYSPRAMTAKAGMPTTLIMSSKNAYGCQAAFTIPKLGIRKNLPVNGDTSFDLGSQPADTRLTGVCTMGMYSFTIDFN